jgi:type I site-specific restriction-modification system R (restriction) subunit
MVFYTGKIVLAMDNPTVLVITDRNDLDDQLFDTFAASRQLLRQEPVQAEEPRAPEGAAEGGGGRRGVLHHPEVPARPAATCTTS